MYNIKIIESIVLSYPKDKYKYNFITGIMINDPRYNINIKLTLSDHHYFITYIQYIYIYIYIFIYAPGFAETAEPS